MTTALPSAVVAKRRWTSWRVGSSGRRSLLEADPGAGQVAANGVARDAQLACDPFGPESLGDQLMDPIHRLRREHPGVLLRASQGDGSCALLADLRDLQVDQIRVRSVHITLPRQV